MNSLDPEVPEVGEEIHLPGPSVEPLLITIGITAMLIGVTFHIVLVILGLILTVWQSAKWIRETRQEIAELPDEH